MSDQGHKDLLKIKNIVNINMLINRKVSGNKLSKSPRKFNKQLNI